MDESRALSALHRVFAVEANNVAWALISRGDLAIDERNACVEHAWASLFHWRACGAPINVGRAYGTVSRAMLLVGSAHVSLDYATRYGLHALDKEGESWDVVFSLMGQARALAALGRLDEAKLRLDEARSACARIEDIEDRQICEADLAVGPWFGLDPATSHP